VPDVELLDPGSVEVDLVRLVDPEVETRADDDRGVCGLGARDTRGYRARGVSH
jgi:hypothetical protein